jgi:NTE family protein
MVDNAGPIGLALSGGGFRATLFHLGAAWRLNELGLLSRLDTVSSVSGGSILSGLMAVRWSSLSFKDGVAVNFQEAVVDPIWRFCGRNVDFCAAVGNILPRVNLLSLQYERGLVGRLTLRNLPDSPKFVFNAAHLETGRNWTFSKSQMRTYRLGSVECPEVRLSDVIAASSSYPLFFAPVVLSLNPNDFQRTELADLFHRRDLKRSVSLADGGLYDNLGVHAIRDFGTLLVSDASSPLEAEQEGGLFGRFLQRTKRPIDMAVEQSRALRRRDLVSQLEGGEKRGAMWTVRTPPVELST